MKITGFNHIGLNAVDKHDETFDFYTKFLGLKDIERSGAATLVSGFWVGNERPLVHVITDKAEGPLAMPNNTHLSLYVENIGEAVAEVKNRTEEFFHVGEGKSQIIWFKDPAGNTVELQHDPDIEYYASCCN